jgi:hypothetical protein
MANVTNPLFSLSAKGSFGSNFFFQERKGRRFTFCLYRTEKIHQSISQMFFRRVFGVVAETWRIETQATIDAFNHNAIGKNLSGFALYYRTFFEAIASARCGPSVCGLTRAGIFP